MINSSFSRAAAAALALAGGAFVASPMADSTQAQQRPAIVSNPGQRRGTKRTPMQPLDFGGYMPTLEWVRASPSFSIARTPTGALAIRRAARKRRNVARNKAHHRHARGRRN